ncbi:kinase-like domain-containing protein [Rhizophagus irregularis DAOM 181602=DAOM 197198]|nr:kinase-like domain-containing protein [Rhizophagus irregularis DAOM 181602=DAOM 197198]
MSSYDDIKCKNCGEIFGNIFAKCEFLNELKGVKAYYINYDDCVLKTYGLSQNPDTKEYIMVLQYANIGNLNSYNNINRNWNWEEKVLILKDIIEGLMKINILLSFATDIIISGTGNSDFYLYISDMGLCGDVSNIDETNTYGVMPYVAPEVLKGKPYTQEADIYSFEFIDKVEEYRIVNLLPAENSQLNTHSQAYYTS